MARLIWSPKAADDLEAVCEYIARDSGHYARLFAARIIALVEQIAEFPTSGRVVPEYDDHNVRERILQNYRVVYRTKPDSAEIVAIVHAARLLKNL